MATPKTHYVIAEEGWTSCGKFPRQNPNLRITHTYRFVTCQQCKRSWGAINGHDH